MKPYVKLEIKDGIGTIEFFHPQSNSLPVNILQKLADTITGNAPLANKMMLNTIQRIDRMGESEGYFVESLASALTQTSEDAREGMRAFLEKRKIRFDE